MDVQAYINEICTPAELERAELEEGMTREQVEGCLVRSMAEHHRKLLGTMMQAAHRRTDVSELQRHVTNAQVIRKITAELEDIERYAAVHGISLTGQ